MNAKEFLSQVRVCERQIQNDLDEIRHLRARAEKITPEYGGETVSRTRDVTSRESTILRLIEKQNAMQDEIDKLTNLKLDVEDVIRKLPVGDERFVLELRYIRGYNWHNIAYVLGKEERTAYRLHDRALESVENLIQEHGTVV